MNISLSIFENIGSKYSCFGMLLFIFSCSDDDDYLRTRCMSCIAESNSGRIVNYLIECNNDEYLKSYAEGVRLYYKENGDTVLVRCIYGQYNN